MDLKILVLTSTLPAKKTGTHPSFVLDLCFGLAKLGFEIYIVAPMIEDAPRYIRIPTEGPHPLTIHRYPYAPRGMHALTAKGGILANLKRNPINYIWVIFLLLAQFRTVYQLLRSKKFDLIHAHWIFPQAWIAILLKRLLKLDTPILGTSHGGDLYSLKGKFFKRLKQSTVQALSHLTVVSQAMKQFCTSELSIGPSRVDVISMGVNLTNLFSSDSHTVRSTNEILFVGRLVEKKGVHILLNAFAAAHANHPRITLTIAGDGPLKESLVTQTQALALTDHVTFTGPLPPPEVANQLTRACFLVMPSLIAADGDQEGLGLVTIEAMGCHCPVLASDLPAISDVVKHEETGIVFKSNSVSDLAGALDYSLRNPKKLRQLSEQGAKHVREHYSIEAASVAYEALIKKLLALKY